MALLSLFAPGPDASPRPAGEVDALYRRYRFRVMMAITAGYGIAYTCRLAINVVKKPLIDGGIFTPVELGLIGSALFYTYAVGKLVNGFVADHVSARRFLSAGVLASALCAVGMGFSKSVWLAVLLWGLNGWFQSFGAPTCVVAMAQWFSNRERGRYYGIWSTAHSIGEGLTFAGVSAAAGLLGWRWGFWTPGLICIAVAGWMYLMIADRPQAVGLPKVADWRKDHGAKPPSEVAPPSRGVFATQISILKLPAVWILALSSASVYVTRYAIDSWGILYLQEERGYSLAAAGSLLTASTLTGMLGAIAFGFLSDTVFGARRPPAILIFALIELGGLLLLFWGPNNSVVVLIALLLFGFGLTGLVTSLGGLFAVDICPKRVAGAAMGFIGIFSYLGAAVQEQVSGFLIQRGMTIVDGVRHYDFTPAISFWIGASVVATLLPLTLWRTRMVD